MKDIKLLDCTLRDGGYVNDWKFGHKNIISIFQRLVDSGVDIIEVGFIDERRPYDIDRTIVPNTLSFNDLFCGVNKKASMVVGMIDYGTCSIENISPCSESFLDGIRVIFKKHLMNEAMAFCRELKNLGYKVFAQLVSITSYEDDDLYEIAKLVNDIKPFALSMVDTYGLMQQEDLIRYYNFFDENIDEDVVIGFHAHNNFQLAYANGIAFLSKNSKHSSILVDGTLYGMGKSAGNAPIELLAMTLNDKFGKNYDTDSMLECIDESIMEFHDKTPWGYKPFFYICGKNKCHPNYLAQYQEKQNLSVSKIDKLLGMIEPEDKKLLYDKLLAEKLYDEFLEENNLEFDMLEQLKKELAGKNLLIVGPGKNIHLQIDNVKSYIKSEKPYIISINYIPDDIDVDCVFVTNNHRYRDMTLDLINRKVKIIATTNVESKGGRFDFVVSKAPLIEKQERIVDNPFLMIIELFIKIGIKGIACAGLDGYSEKKDNYYNPSMEYFFIKQEANYLNYHVKKKIDEFRKKIDIRFITYSAYDILEDNDD